MLLRNDPEAAVTLRHIRMHRLDECEKVVLLGGHLITTGQILRLGDEKFDIYEQVAIAALQIGQDREAIQCINRLIDQFPTSPRVAILRGMLLEVQSPNKAESYYDEILKLDQTLLVSVCLNIRRLIMQDCQEAENCVLAIKWTAESRYRSINCPT